MPKLTIEITASVNIKLRRLQRLIDRGLSPLVKKGLDEPISIEQVAAALVTIGLSKSTTDKVVLSTMLALRQLQLQGRL